MEMESGIYLIKVNACIRNFTLQLQMKKLLIQEWECEIVVRNSFRSQLRYRPSLQLGRYCQPQTEYYPTFPYHSCNNICICNSMGRPNFTSCRENGSEIARGAAECNFAVLATSGIYPKISLLLVLSRINTTASFIKVKISSN